MSDENNSQKEQSEAERFAVEPSARLSDACIWKLLEDFYRSASVSAWEQVPFYVTSNPFIAGTYADIILAFLSDYSQELNLEQPLYVVEMAAGSGCFSFYLLKELKKRLQYFERLRKLRLRYIMTDFTPNIVQTWQKSEKFRPFVNEGLLSFGLFRPEDDAQILCCAEEEAGFDGEVLLGKGMSANPLIAIANYFFDSIKQDAFQIQDGKLMEVRHTFYCKRDPESSDAVKLENLSKSETYHQVPVDYYDDHRLNDVLKNYCQEFENASILFPLGPLKCIANLQEISDNNLVLISSDKGYTRADHVSGLYEQPYVAHDVTFSYSVNFDAIRRYFAALGGVTLTTSDDSLTISTAVSYLLKQNHYQIENSRYVFAERVDRLNPSNYLHGMQVLITESETTKSNDILRACLGYVQLSNCDPRAFCMVAPRLYAALETITSAQERRLLEVLERVSENVYSGLQYYNAHYWAGKMYYHFDRYDDALKSFTDAIATFGESTVVFCFMGCCYEMKLDYEKSIHCYNESLRLDPSYEYAEAGIKRVNGYILEKQPKRSPNIVWLGERRTTNRCLS